MLEEVEELGKDKTEELEVLEVEVEQLLLVKEILKEEPELQIKDLLEELVGMELLLTVVEEVEELHK